MQRHSNDNAVLPAFGMKIKMKTIEMKMGNKRSTKRIQKKTTGKTIEKQRGYKGNQIGRDAETNRTQSKTKEKTIDNQREHHRKPKRTSENTKPSKSHRPNHEQHATTTDKTMTTPIWNHRRENRPTP